jgi:hypothetical protein
MEFLSLILAVVALVAAILAYQRAGGVADVKKQIDHITSSVDFKKSIDSLTAAADTLRGKTAEAIGRLEDAVRGEEKEEKKPSKKVAPKKGVKREKVKRDDAEKVGEQPQDRTALSGGPSTENNS